MASSPPSAKELPKPVAVLLSIVCVLVAIGALIGLLSSFFADPPAPPDPCTRLTAGEVARFVPQANQGIPAGKNPRRSCEWRGPHTTLSLNLKAHAKLQRRSRSGVARSAVQDEWHDGKKHTERRRVRLETSDLGLDSFARTPPVGHPASYATIVFHRSGVSAILTITYADPTMTVHQAQAQAVEAARIVHGRLPKER